MHFWAMLRLSLETVCTVLYSVLQKSLYVTVHVKLQRN